MECSWDGALLHAIPQLPAEVLETILNGSNEEYLTALARAALQPDHVYTLLASCEDLFVALLTRIHQHVTPSELVSVLGCVVPLAPHLTDCAVGLLQQHTFDLSGISAADNVTRYLLGFLRLLQHKYRAFESMVDLSKVSSMLQSPVSAHRYLAIRILQLSLNGADHWLEEIIRTHIGEDDPKSGLDAVWDDKTIDYRFLTLWEEWRHQRFSTASSSSKGLCNKNALAKVRVIKDSDLGTGCLRVGQTVLYRKSITRSIKDHAFTITESASRNLIALGQALKHEQPILLLGPASAGKTSLVRHVATQLDKQHDLITLHLNEQSDAKLLIGVYTTGDTPGSITWKPGVLTTAVQEGRWVLIEDLDRAPNHVLGTLLPLIETRTLSISSRKQIIHAHQDFRIFGSHSLKIAGKNAVPLSSMLGRRHWIDVSVEPMSSLELCDIIQMRYPSLERLLPQMLAVFEEIRNCHASSGFTNKTQSGIIRPVSIADFFKWCSRAVRHLGSTNVFTTEALDHIYIEALDCFTSALSHDQSRQRIEAVIAQHLNIDPQRRDFLTQHRPIQYSEAAKFIKIGRCSIERSVSPKTLDHESFAANDHVLRNMERIAAAFEGREPVLLVGETGVGKTTAVQHLARQLGKKLVPFNLSQQSESGDLLGSLKPMSIRTTLVALKDEFNSLFEASFSHSKNQQFVEQVNKHFVRSQFKQVCKLWRQALKLVEAQASVPSKHDETPSKKRKPNALDPARMSAWTSFASKLADVERQIASGKDGLTFRFVEGNIVKALREGDWILLDEINLAASDTLEAIADILDPDTPSILLTEGGDPERIVAHPNFRVFAAMNPATDVGKKDLPPSIRSRFTEIYVSSPDRDLKSLQSIVQAYLRKSPFLDPKIAMDVSLAYQQIISLSAQNKLVDGAGQRPHFSLRTLTRVLSYARFIAPQCSLRRALYEGFQMSFMTFLDAESARLVLPIIQEYLLRKPTNWNAELKKVLRKPEDADHYVLAYPSSKHWIKRGKHELEDESHYIITPFIERNLENLVRASSTRQFPVLIQGPTSSGKTSMIEYLAKRTGNVFVRINNHEHTDLQEYLGTYVSSSDGTIRFQEGLLVQALREGHWIVLDELNLAPTDVLEALNRLLDDNRELLIPETQETVRPHPNFMLFATQNPAGLYGGRKTLSRAFRNRFLELHFDDIPIDELQEILHRRTQLPESRCKKIVSVYKELSILRQENRLFEQKSFATLRDLFRWAFRTNDTIEQLAQNGFMLLAERVRKPQERAAIKETLEKVMSMKGPKVLIDESMLYALNNADTLHLRQRSGHSNVVWTSAIRRLFTLVANAIKHNEPVLLVGDTGCGKTTVCQMIAEAHSLPLHVVNAHQNTETSDLIGSQRPVRNRSAIDEELREAILSTALMAPDVIANTPLDQLLTLLEQHISNLDEQSRAAILRSATHQNIASLAARRKILFEWVDGSLVQAMKSGHMFLLDEISLADDSVLERMNSVLESSRSVLLAEKGSIDSLVTARPGFQFLATMNPGGDYGKKELSPALRNRFTEIWVPPMTEVEDVLQIVQHGLISVARLASSGMIEFAQWFTTTFRSADDNSLSIRELLAWVSFVNLFAEQDLDKALVHGAALVYIDTLGTNPAGMTSITSRDVRSDRDQSLQRLSTIFGLSAQEMSTNDSSVVLTEDRLSVGPFHLARRQSSQPHDAQFNFAARTTRLNALRIVRAMQLSKPIMLEGNPGVGKTALVVALAANAGVPLTRINLSDQTDLIDLFGSDAPVEGSATGTFEWREAPFLRAMRHGQWVLLDEMNLASQSVLEGLNAVLDHRGEAYVPELGQSFVKHPDFRIFAAQNPHHQGGGRKGLPASFINRFTVVYAEPFDAEDLQLLGSAAFPAIDADYLRKIVHFVSGIDSEVSSRKLFGQNGSPWEFNFRDITKWLQLATSDRIFADAGNAIDFADFLIKGRFRTAVDKAVIASRISTVFGQEHTRSDMILSTAKSVLQVGLAVLSRKDLHASMRDFAGIRACQGFDLIQRLMLCVQFAWPALLVGPAGSGKSTMIKQLAIATGNEHVTISLSADTDAMDLIGGYEQSDQFREVSARLLLFDEQYELSLKVKMLSQDYDELATVLQAWRTLCHKYHIGSISYHDLRRGLVQLPGMNDLLEALDAIMPTSDTAHFVWVDGVLIEALKSGKWIIIDNANLCSASVLDRLNSLLEPNGTLIINEHVEGDGSPIVVKPHADTRLFLTADPQYGELSRAMRNRAVELFVEPLQHSLDTAKQLSCESSLQRFQHAAVLNTLAPSVDAKTLTTLLTQQLSMSDYDLLPRYVEQLLLGLYGLADEQLGLTSALQHLQKPLPVVYNAQLSALYREAADVRHITADFASVQTIHPLNHQLLLQYNESIFTNAVRLGLCNDLLNAVMPLLYDLDSSRSHKGQLTKLLRVESQYFSALSTIQNPQRPILLTVLEKIARGQIEHYTSRSHDHAPVRFARFALDRRLSQVLRLLYNAATRQEIDPAQLVSYGFIVRKMLTETCLSLQPVLLQQIDSMLGQDQDDTPGRRNDNMWRALKPAVPQSLQALQSLSDFEALCLEFDAVNAGREQSSGHAVHFRSSLRQVYQDAQRNDADSLDELTAQLKQTLADAQLSSQNLHQGTAHFSDVFQSLWFRFDSCQRLDNAGISLDLQQHTALLGGVPLLDGLLADMRVESFDIKVLPDYRLTNDVTRPLKSTQVPLATLLKRVASCETVSIRRLPSLRAEVDVVSRSILGGSQDVQAQEVQILDATLSKLHSTLKTVLDEWTTSHLRDSNDPEDLDLRKVTEYLHGPPTDVIERSSDASTAWIAIGLTALRLYLPMTMHDPGLTLMLDRAAYDSCREDLQDDHKALTLFTKQLTGRSESWRLRISADVIHNLGIAPPLPDISRPAVSQMVPLHNDLQGLKRLLADFYNAFRADQTSRAQANVMATLPRIRAHLLQEYRHYHDFVGPVVAFIDCLLVGFELRLQSEVQKQCLEQKSLISSVVPFLDKEASCCKSVSQIMDALPAKASIPDRLLWLEIVCSRRTLWQPQGPNQDLLARINQQFAACYDLWRAELTLDQKQHAAKSSLFRYQGTDEEDDETQLEAEIAELFSSSSGEDAELSNSTSRRIQLLAPEIASIHSRIFLSGQTTGTDVMRVLSQIGAHHAEQIPHDESTTALPIILPQMQVLSRRIASDSAPPSSYNFYKHGCSSKVESLRLMLQQIVNRFDKIHAEWPEHALPTDIMISCNKILDLPNTSTLHGLFQPIEQLHALLNEWQKIAHSGISASDLYNAVTDTIIDWRRFELSTWAALFRHQDQQCEEDAMSWWFTAYETIIASVPVHQQQLDQHITTLIGTLQIFLEGCGIGEYSARLRLLAQFICQLQIRSKDDSGSSSLVDALRNVVSYYARHQSTISQHLAHGRAKLETAVKEVVQLASWKDRNIDSLRQSAQSSHKKLARILRKYRKLLAQPAQGVLSAANDTKLDQHIPLPVQDDQNIFSETSTTTGPIADVVWEQRPDRYKHVPVTVRLMLQKTSAFSHALGASDHLSSFFAGVKQEIKELRSATPSVKTEKNQHLLGQLKTRKRRLLAEVLKQLRLMGLQHNISDDVLRRQSSVPDVFLNLGYLDADDTQQSTTNVSKTLYCLLSSMNTAREAARKHSDDLTSNEARRCIMLLESLLSLSLLQHNQLIFVKEASSRFKDMQSKITELALSENVVACNAKRTSERMSELENVLLMASAGVDLITMHFTLTQQDQLAAVSHIRTLIQQGYLLLSSIQTLSDFGDYHAQARMSTIEELFQKTSTISLVLQELQQSHPELTYIISLAKSEVPDVPITYPSGQVSIDLSSWIKRMLRSLDHILARIDAFNLLASSIQSDTDWLKIEQKTLDDASRALRMSDTVSEFHDLMESLSGLSGEDVRDAMSALAAITPILQAYGGICEQFMAQYIRLHQSTLTVAYGLASIWIDLAKNGFCAPSEKSAGDESGSSKAEAGTGLGDGEGAEDISKDIDQTEDLSEMAQQESRNEGEDEIEDEKDAVDMADEDLQGEVGSDDADQEDQGSDAEAEEERDLDEEIGDVDSDDAGALDEKSWDDGKLDEGRSKEDNKGKGTKDEEVAAGQEDGEKQDSAEEQPQEDVADGSELGADDEVMDSHEAQPLDAFAKEEEILDLPDDLNMDDEIKDDDISGSDMDMNDASDEEVSGAQEEQPNDQLDENFEDTNHDQETAADQADNEETTQVEDEVNEDLLQTEAEGGLDDDRDQDGIVTGAPGGGHEEKPEDTIQDGLSTDELNDAQGVDSGEQTEKGGTAGKSRADLDQSTEDMSMDNDTSRAAAQYKKLGDVLEKWSKQHQIISKADETEDATMNEDAAETESAAQVEHLRDEDQQADTQALGMGGMDQGTALPDDMSVDDEEGRTTPEPPTLQHDALNATETDTSEQAEPEVDLQQQQRQKEKAFVGKQNLDAEDDIMASEDDDESRVEDMDVKLVNTHISDEGQSSTMDSDEARRLWSEHESSTRHLSLSLTEHLRLILQPTQATRMRGDFRTGKRLNIKKIIPYIASSYRRDKIWMRRSVPSKRQYQIMLAIDDSKSMAEGDNKILAYETLAMVSRALTMLEVGELCVVSFGNRVTVAHDFATPLAADAGPELFRHFTFDQAHTDVRKMLAESIELFRAARLRTTGSSSDLWQLQIIVSDGMCEDHPGIRQLVRQAQEERIMIVFIVVDTVIGNEGTSAEKKQSILDLKKAEFAKDASGDMQLQMVQYLDTFPFRYYLLVSDVQELPAVLAGALRQWFSEVADTGS